MRTFAAGVLGLVALSLSGQPSIVITNAKVFDNPSVRAVAITGDKITAIGSDAVIAALATPQTRVIDAQGRLLIPGFNDAHTHPGTHTASFVANSDIETSWPNIAAAIKAAVDETPAELWITATAGPAVINDTTLTRQTLDKLAPGRKVFVNAFTGHGAVLSSAALAALNIPLEKDPAGGAFERDAQGNLNGRLSEYGHYIADRHFAELASEEELIAGIRGFAEEAARFGITSVQAMPMPGDARFAKALRSANVPLRVRHITFPVFTAARPELAAGGALKLILDGTPIERGAALRRAQYADGTRGKQNFRDLAPFVKLAVDNNQQLLFHTCGDATVAAALQAFAGAPALKRPRLEHADGLQSDLFPLARKTGAVVVVNPTHFPFRGFYPAGEYMLAKSILNAQIPLAIGSDGPFNPGLNIMFAVARPDTPGESITREEAIRAYTTGSAFAENQETKKGKIAVGMLADLAVLSQDILTAPVETLPDTVSVLTIIDGKVVFEQ
jgi:predicted amidohydrolase YtcJ